MIRRLTIFAAGLFSLSLLAIAGCSQEPPARETAAAETPSVPRTIDPLPEETHFGELTMLTDGGQNAEAYFSFGSDRLVFQATPRGGECDQIYTMDLAGSEPHLVSTGLGRTTCAYFTPGDVEVVYASTHLGGEECPEEPDRSMGYVWGLFDSYDLFKVDLESGELTRLTETDGYDAEATISPLGDKIVFTSVRDGDLDIYTMNLDGTEVARLTDEPGYDGGPFFSPDGSMIVYRAHHPDTPEELARYRELLAAEAVAPSRMDVWVMNSDGSGKRQVTDLGGASFAPFFHPSGEKIVFSSNHHDPSGREFDLFMVDLDGGNLKQVTFAEGFDGFPMFSPDGSTFVFASNRDNSAPRETNVFVTRWQD